MVLILALNSFWWPQGPSLGRLQSAADARGLQQNVAPSDKAGELHVGPGL